MEEDLLISTIGQFGPYHIILCSLTGLTIVIHAWQMLINKFLTIPVLYHCKPPAYLADDIALQRWIEISAPKLSNGQYDHCHIFDIDYHGLKQRPTNESSASPRLIKCTEWIYDTSRYQETAIMRWDLVCDKKYYPLIIQFLFFTGTFLGVLTTGFLADFFGRIKAYKFWLFMWIFCTILETFLNSFWLWTAMRFFAGGASIAFNTCQTVYCVEFAGQKWRSITNYFFRVLPFCFGHLSLALLVYLVPNMKRLELFIGVSGIPFLVILFFLHESPRWLYVNGYIKEASEVVRIFCINNRRPLTDTHLTNLEKWFKDQGNQDSVENNNLSKLKKYQFTLRNLVLINLCWFSCSMSTFGLLYNMPSFGLDDILVFAIHPLTVLPFVFIFPFLENRYGCKILLFFIQVIGGIFLILTVFIPLNTFQYDWPLLVMSYAGICSSGFIFNIVYSYTRELFPTTVRSSCLSLASSSARIGSMFSTVIAISSAIDPMRPIQVYGVISVLAGIGSIFIWPETKNLALFNTLEESEAAANTPNKWLSFLRNRRGRVDIAESAASPFSFRYFSNAT